MPAKQQSNKDDKNWALILYRIEKVEGGVDSINQKLDRQETLKPSDLEAFKNVIIEKISDINDDLQKQIDKKADLADLTNLKQLVYGFASVIVTIITSYIIWSITKG